MSLDFLKEVIYKNEQQGDSSGRRDGRRSTESVPGRNSLCKGLKVREDTVSCNTGGMRMGT